jgi:hypothetical protein
MTETRLNSATFSHIHRERLDALWTSLHCFNRDFASKIRTTRADAFLDSLTEKLAGILLFVAINDKLFTVLEADSI